MALGAPEMVQNGQHQSRPPSTKPLPKETAPPKSTQSAIPRSTGTRNRRHDSVTSPPSPTAPKRSRSWRSAYNRVFGSSTRKSLHKDEKPEEEIVRLQKTVQRQEQELEEASNVIILQDKVLVKLDKQIGKLSRASSRPQTPGGVENGGPSVPRSPVDKQGNEERRLTPLREVSREMLNEAAADGSEREALKQNIRDLERELEETKSSLAAAQSAAIEKQEEIEKLQKLQVESKVEIPEEPDREKDDMKSEIERLTAELETAKKPASSEVAPNASAEDPSMALEEATNAIKELKARIADLEVQLSDVKSNAEKASADHAASREASSAQVEELRGLHEQAKSALQDTEMALTAAKADHEQTAKLRDEALASKDLHIRELQAKHDATSGELAATNEAFGKSKEMLEKSMHDLENANARISELTANHENLNNELQDSKAALEAALVDAAHAKEAADSESKNANARISELTANHESLNNELQDSKAALEAALVEAAHAKEAADIESKNANARISELTANHESLNNKLQDSKAALEAALVEAAHAKEAADSESKATFQRLTAELEESQSRIRSLSMDIEARTNDIDDASAALSAAQVEITELKAAAEARDSDQQAVKDQLAALQEALESAKASSKAESEASLARIAELSAEVDKAAATRDELNRAEEELNGLRRDAEMHAGQQEEHTRALSQIEVLKKQIDGHAATSAELQEEHVKALSQIEDLEKQIDGHVATSAELQQEIERLKQDAETHATQQVELERAQTQVTELQARIEELTESAASNVEREMEHEAAKSQILELQKEIQKLEAEAEQHAAQQAEFQMAQARLEKLQEELDGHISSKIEMQKRIDEYSDLQAELEAARKQNTDLSKDVENFDLAKAELTEAKSQIEEMGRDIESHASVKADLDAAHIRIAELTKDLEGHGAEREELEAARVKITDMSKEIEEHEEVKLDLLSTRRQVEDLKRDFDAESTSHGETKERLEALQSLIAKAEEDHNSIAESLSAKQAELSQVQVELGATKEQVKNLEVALEVAQAASAKAKEHEALLMELETKKKEAEDKILTTEAALEKNKSENEATLRELQSKVSDLERMNSAHAELNKSLEENKARQETELEEMRAQLDDFESLKTKYDEISKDLQESQAHHANRVHDLEVKLLELESLNEEHTQLRDQLHVSQQREQELQSSLEKAQAEVQEIRSTHAPLATMPGFEKSNGPQKDGHFTEALADGAVLGVAAGLGVELEKVHEDHGHVEPGQTEEIADSQAPHSVDPPTIELGHNDFPQSAETQGRHEVGEHPPAGNETREIPTGDGEELRGNDLASEVVSDTVRPATVDVSEEPAVKPVEEEDQPDQTAEGLHEPLDSQTTAAPPVEAHDEICETSETHTDKAGHNSPEGEEHIPVIHETSILEEPAQDSNAESQTTQQIKTKDEETSQLPHGGPIEEEVEPNRELESVDDHELVVQEASHSGNEEQQPVDSRVDETGKEEGSGAPEQTCDKPNEDHSISEPLTYSEPAANEANSSRQEEEAPVERDDAKAKDSMPESEIQSSLEHPENSNMHDTSEIPVADQVISSAEEKEDHLITEQQHPQSLDAIERGATVEGHIATEDRENDEPSDSTHDLIEQPGLSGEDTEKDDNSHHETGGQVEHHVEENGPNANDKSEGAAPSLEERLTNETHPDGETETGASLGELHEDGQSHESSAPEHRGFDAPQHNEEEPGGMENSDDQAEPKITTDPRIDQETANAKPGIETGIAQEDTEAISGDIQEHHEPQSDVLTMEALNEPGNDDVEEVEASNTEPQMSQQLKEQDSNRNLVEHISEEPEAVGNIGTPQQDEQHHQSFEDTKHEHTTEPDNVVHENHENALDPGLEGREENEMLDGDGCQKQGGLPSSNISGLLDHGELCEPSKYEQKDIQSAQVEPSADERSKSKFAVTGSGSEEQSQGVAHPLPTAEETPASDPASGSHHTREDGPELIDNSKTDATHRGEHPAEEDPEESTIPSTQSTHAIKNHNDELASGTVHGDDEKGDDEESAKTLEARASVLLGQIKETVVVPITEKLPDTVALSRGEGSEEHVDAENEEQDGSREIPLPDTSGVPKSSAE